MNDPETAAGTRRIGLVQMRCEPDFGRNLSHAQDAIADAARKGADIVCLPELFRTPYLCQSEDPSRFDWAESVPGPSTEVLAKQAEDLGISLIASLFERRSAGLYHNTAVVLNARGEIAGRYRKMHIPDDPLYYEKFYFTPGDLGFSAHQTEAGRLGVLLCWDQWFPEAARVTTLAGADFLFYPTAIGWQFDESEAVDQAQVDAWRTIQRGHAIANGVFVIAVNRVGHEKLDGVAGEGIRFWGGSFVVDPLGRILGEAPDDEEAILVVDCELALIERVRRDWPFLRDRRIDSYAGLGARFLDEPGAGDRADPALDAKPPSNPESAKALDSD